MKVGLRTSMRLTRNPMRRAEKKVRITTMTMTRIKRILAITGIVALFGAYGFVGHEDFKVECCTPHDCEIVGRSIITPKGNVYNVPKSWDVHDGEYKIYFADNRIPFDFEEIK